MEDKYEKRDKIKKPKKEAKKIPYSVQFSCNI